MSKSKKKKKERKMSEKKNRWKNFIDKIFEEVDYDNNAIVEEMHKNHVSLEQNFADRLSSLESLSKELAKPKDITNIGDKLSTEMLDNRKIVYEKLETIPLLLEQLSNGLIEKLKNGFADFDKRYSEDIKDIVTKLAETATLNTEIKKEILDIDGKLDEKLSPILDMCKDIKNDKATSSKLLAEKEGLDEKVTALIRKLEEANSNLDNLKKEKGDLEENIKQIKEDKEALNSQYLALSNEFKREKEMIAKEKEEANSMEEVNFAATFLEKIRVVDSETFKHLKVNFLKLESGLSDSTYIFILVSIIGQYKETFLQNLVSKIGKEKKDDKIPMTDTEVEFYQWLKTVDDKINIPAKGKEFNWKSFDDIDNPKDLTFKKYIEVYSPSYSTTHKGLVKGGR